jgi:C-terminal peptidase prc
MINRRLAYITISLSLIVAACVGDTGEGPTPTIAPGTTAPSATSTTANDEADAIETVACDEAPEDVAIICEAYDLIKANYVDDIGDAALVDAAVEGLALLAVDESAEPFVCPLPSEEFMAMCEAAANRNPEAGTGPIPVSVSSTLAEVIVASFAIYGLDPNSLYLDENALELLQEEQAGEIEGIGALVSAEDETLEGENKQCAILSDTCQVVIASTIEGTPAEAAGIESGDVIVGVDGEDVIGWTIEELTARVRGPAGSDVDLTILRNGETFDVTITRAAVVIPVLETALFGNDGYIRLRVFNGTADEQFQSAVIDMVADGIDDLVVDLRNNPGGLLDTAIEITSVFLPSGDVVVTEGPNDENTYPVTGASLIPEDVEVVFVVNGGSASASEVVSAVLQERDRALVVGENTFGKNTVQQRFSLSNGGALKLTIARWLTPGGLDFGGVGVTPDVELTFDSDATPSEVVAAVVNLG